MEAERLALALDIEGAQLHGQFGQFSLDGTNDWMTMKADSITSTTADFTLAASVSEGTRAILRSFSRGSPIPTKRYLGIDVENSAYPDRGTLKCGFWSNNLEYRPGDTSLDSTWHHVACVADHTNGHAAAALSRRRPGSVGCPARLVRRCGSPLDGP